MQRQIAVAAGDPDGALTPLAIPGQSLMGAQGVKSLKIFEWNIYRTVGQALITSYHKK